MVKYKENKKYLNCVADLLENDDVLRLSEFRHHINNDRLSHSIRVSYYSYIIALKLNLDFRSVARGGLLHDLFLYEWREKHSAKEHSYEHPKEALRNAICITNVNDKEENIILSHMFPMSRVRPKYKESIIVSTVDKICATLELILSIFINDKKDDEKMISNTL